MNDLPHKIVVLGSTGSVGTQTLDVIKRLGGDIAQIVALAAHRNVDLLATQARETGASHVAVTDAAYGKALQDALSGTTTIAGWGDATLDYLAALPEADTVVIAVAGSVALSATLAACRAGKRVCIATKEVLVAAGELVMTTAKAYGATILPIDSEHSAIFQCIQGYQKADIAKIILTASGGPFRTWTADRIEAATIADALNHPTWRMGGKITIDSATLMNKGLEVIEACRLFDIPIADVDVVVHPQSVIHSFVEMRDGALLAQLGLPDMRLPIEIALMHPLKIDIGLPRLQPSQIGNLTFETPDHDRFPAIELARRSVALGGTAPAVLNGANEAAVALFLEGKIGFAEIVRRVEAALNRHTPYPADSLQAIQAADNWARRFVNEPIAVS